MNLKRILFVAGALAISSKAIASNYMGMGQKGYGLYGREFSSRFSNDDDPCVASQGSSGVMNCKLKENEFIDSSLYKWSCDKTICKGKPMAEGEPGAILYYLDDANNSKYLGLGPGSLSVTCDKGNIFNIYYPDSRYPKGWLSCIQPKPQCHQDNDQPYYDDQWACDNGSDKVNVKCADKGFSVSYVDDNDSTRLICKSSDGSTGKMDFSYPSGSNIIVNSTYYLKCIINKDVGFWQKKSDGSFQCFINNPSASSPA